ncbi:MAG: phenylalanine--tRNA ligase subunit beta [Verrucomicrobiota bacterium JB022]|nr:phenylalanine--tRNA ligase subunit beta [Verrucomicrobiota bacterium JB022]
MKISRNWLQRYVDLADQSNEAIAHALTMVGFEVEGIEQTGLPQLDHVVVGEILSYEPHPDADKLSVCQVDVGQGEPQQIICGAKNFKQNDRVIAALPGAVLPGDFRIEPRKMRGVQSNGMLCSESELGLAEESDGIAILEERPEVGTPINVVFSDNDTIFDVEITPNRPDALSHIGIAREMSAWFRRELSYPEIRLDPTNAHRGSLVGGLRVEADERCPHYLGYSIRNVKVQESPKWLKRALQAIGLRPINNVVDITNYVLHELGHPMHAFDVKKIAGSVVVVRLANEGEKITTLDHKERTLTADTLVIADAERPLVIAGVMGSVEAEVDETTTDIFLEVAYFRASFIRRTSRQYGLSSDSSYRYERGIDPKGAEYAAMRAIDLIVQVTGGDLMGPPLSAGEPPLIEQSIDLPLQFVYDRLGFTIEENEVVDCLRYLELDVRREESNGQTTLRVGIPSFRLDLYRPIDLVEEILRIYGCEKIPATTSRFPSLLAEDAPSARLTRRVSQLLLGKGFNEAMHYTLRPESELSTWAAGANPTNLALQNPLASDASHLRPSLLPGLLDCLALNQARGNEPQRLFETGRVFREFKGQVHELTAVAFVLSQKAPSQWSQRQQPDFYTASALIQEVLKGCGVSVTPDRFGPVEGTGVWQGGHSAGFGRLQMGFEAQFGLLDVKLTHDADIEGGVLAGEIVLTPDFLQRPAKRARYSSFSQFPTATRDLALLVDASEPSGKVRNKLEGIGRKATGKDFDLEQVEVFDVYLGQGLPDGKKSLAFSLTFRSADRTLTEKEVNAAFTQIQHQMTKGTGYELRS